MFTSKPPQDEPFLANIGLPWMVLVVYNKLNRNYVYANFQIDCYEDEYSDTFFENEYIFEESIREWCYMPPVEHNIFKMTSKPSMKSETPKKFHEMYHG